MSLLPGIEAQIVETPRLRTNVLRRSGPAGTLPLVLVHGNVSSSLFFQPLMLTLPTQINAMAVDLRGFGASDRAPVDARRGLRDFSDDLAEVVDALGLGPVHLIGWSMGGGVVMQYALDHPVRSLTLIAPVSPYGFGGTAADGSLLTPDGAGTGGGGANPDFVARIASGDRSGDAATSPRSVYAATYVKPGFVSEHEDIWVESMLSTATDVDNYPGDSSVSASWPGFSPGERGVLNTMAPVHLNLTGIADLAEKPPVLWIRGAQDVIVSDTSFYDFNFLGQLGAIPSWPGEQAAPPQPMIGQTRRVLQRYAARGGTVRELVLDNCGHSPHLEHPEQVRRALLAHLRAS